MLRRIWGFLNERSKRRTTVPCPACGRAINPLSLRVGTGGGAYRIEKSPGEIASDCRILHGTSHTSAEVHQAMQRRLEWLRNPIGPEPGRPEPPSR